MPQYAYRAINDKGRSVRGQINATNETDLFQQLHELGLELVDAGVVKERKLTLALAPKIKTRDLIQTCMHLEQLSGAGVPLIDALSDLRESTEHARLRNVIAEIYRDVSDGAALSDAFGKHPRIFGPVFTSLLAAGEESGNITESFAQLVKHLKWTDEVNAKVKKAIRYPSFILVMIVVLFTFMMTYVVPQVVGFLEAQGTELPAVTLSLIHTSDFMTNYWYVVLLGPVAAFVLIRAGVKTSYAFAYKVDWVLLNLPTLGPTIRKISLSRFSHFFAVMFNSGVPILQCLETAQRVVVNRCLTEALATVRDQVQTGEPLSSAMKQSGQFPGLVTRMVKIGEESGNLSGTLENVTDFYDRDVDDTVDKIIAMAEPALTVVAGLMMIWIILGVLGPVYDSFENIGG
ncbi:Type IV fimbrial assembly protein PilC [Caenispirillum salinarum AK4]|uniref:Type IV fimbrial assembly protein PilC n=1 Tax=Caenispirillum salinarum AK4 TaxID=1238182 RepID=K9H1X3_9PROT|nr:type II secretion system F family protein [Caenispirillum salinarum]EKV32255.1 Type IV fimbrial assembly protein PilC [Caenispirillum salinarum AK4]